MSSKLITIVLISLVGILMMAGQAIASESPWPMFQHDAQHTGRSSFTGPISESSAITTLIQGAENDHFGSPAIGTDGTLYLGATIDNNHGLYAFNSDGTQKWFYEYGIIEVPTLGKDGTIYTYAVKDVQEGTVLVALSPAGVEKWSRSSDIFCQSMQLLIDGQDNIYTFNFSSDGNGFIKFTLIKITPEGVISEIYHFINPNEEYFDPRWLTSPSMSSDGAIYFGFKNVLYALNSDGSLKWQKEFIDTFPDSENLASALTAPIISSEGNIYFFSNHLQSVSPEGALLWNSDASIEKNTTYPSYTGALGSDGTIYTALKTCHNGYVYNLYLYSIDGLTGQEKWSKNLQNRQYSGCDPCSLPIVDAQGNIFISMGNGLIAFNSNGNLLWEKENYRSVASHFAQPFLAIGKNSALYASGYTKFCAISPQNDLGPKTIYVDDDKPADYLSIQVAIDAANLEDKIIVRDGVYSEKIIIGKNNLSISSENGANSTIIEGALGLEFDSTVSITANNVYFSGFTVSGAHCRPHISIKNDNGISGCEIINNYVISYSDMECSGNGIELENVSDCTINNNTFATAENINKGYYGISLLNSNNNLIKNNKINKFDYGIIFNNSSNNILENNKFRDCISLYFYNNTLNVYNQSIDKSNTIDDKPIFYSYNENGLFIEPDTNFGYLGFINCSNILVKGLTKENVQSILMVNTIDSVIQGGNVPVSLNFSSHNSIVDTDCALISLFNSDHNIVANNQCSDINNNDYDIPLKNSSHNIFFNNHVPDDIILWEASTNNIIRNNISDVSFVSSLSSDNIVYQNDIEFISFGSWFYNLPDDFANNIYLNNINGAFIDSDVSSRHLYSTDPIEYCYQGNCFSGYIGNHWNNYTGYSFDNDGIGDVSHREESSSFFHSWYDDVEYPLIDTQENYSIDDLYPVDSCSNGVKDEAFEQCDGVDFGGFTCESYGFTKGELICTNECLISFENCVTNDFIEPQCSDGIDNDGDGLIDMDDPGCENAEDDDEYNEVQVDNLPVCDIKLQKDGIEIDEINVGESFDINVGNSSDDTGITEVRFLSDEDQNGVVDEGFTWTDWYDWDISKEDWTGHWDSTNKIKTWAFVTPGEKEVWAEVKDNIGEVTKCSVNIIAGEISPIGQYYVKAHSVYFPSGDYSVELMTNDPNQTIQSVSVTGPGIDGSISLEQGIHSLHPNQWWSKPNVNFSFNPPDLPLIYTFTITDVTGTAYEINNSVQSYVDSFATNLSPEGDQTNISSLVFSWTGVDIEAVKYKVELYDENWNRIWDSALITDTSFTYNGPALASGDYQYFISIFDEYGNSSLSYQTFQIDNSPKNQPPTCIIELQNDNGDKINEINVGESFNIKFINYSGDINEARFSSDESQDGNHPALDSPSWTDSPFSWTEPGAWWDWNWNAADKIMQWSFDTSGNKEVWAEVKNNSGTSTCFANIYTNPILSVPYYSQGNTDWCVPTSMSMILKYYGKNIHSWDIAKEWGWNRDHLELFPLGRKINTYFNASDLGLSSKNIEVNFDAICTAIDNKNPVLLSLKSPVQGIKHAVVVVGYSNANNLKQVYISDPSGALLCNKLNLCQKLIAVPVPWDCITKFICKMPLSYAIAVEGKTPLRSNPPKGTLDIDMTGSNGFYFTQDDLQGKIQRVHSWAYGKDYGMGWIFTNNHPLTLNEKDQFKFDGYITNHTESEQMYQIEINFVKDGHSFLYTLPKPINVAGRHREMEIMKDSYPLKDLLGENYGEYTITLTLYNSDFTEKYDKIIFPKIEYMPVCGDGICGEGETFEKCYQDCIYEGIEKYFPYWQFSKDEKYHPTSFYFDDNAGVEDNQKNYLAKKGNWNEHYVYTHVVEDDNYFTIQYWMYMAYNDWQTSMDDHDHDFDATIFVVFNKNDFTKPIEVRFARHLFIGSYSWDTNYFWGKKIEKIGNHVVAYVAKGSHGGYATSNMNSLDVFEKGGELLGLDFFNWYKVGNCSQKIKKEINGQQREFCKVENEKRGGKKQNEPVDGYWPNELIGHVFPWCKNAPWHPDNKRWSQTRPEGLKKYLKFGINCPVDIHVYDSRGNHVGMNYETGKPEIQIPNAIYRKEGEKQYILIPNPTEDDYKIEIIGLDVGDYDLEIVNAQDVEDGETIIFNATDIPTSGGAIHQYTIDWDILSQGGEGTTLKIDLDGDGDFEETIITGETLQSPVIPTAPVADDEPNQIAYTAPSGGGGLPQGLSISGSSIGASTIGKNTATINWLTSLFSTSRVVYSSGDESHDFDSASPFNYGYAHSTQETSTKATGHYITLHDLYPGTTYYYRCISASSPDIIGPEHSFITLGVKEEKTEEVTKTTEGLPAVEHPEKEENTALSPSIPEIPFSEKSVGEEMIAEVEETHNVLEEDVGSVAEKPEQIEEIAEATSVIPKEISNRTLLASLSVAFVEISQSTFLVIVVILCVAGLILVWIRKRRLFYKKQ